MSEIIKKTIFWKKENFVRNLFCIFFVLLGLHLISVYSTHFHGFVIKRIDFNNERNFPTYFATFQLLVCGYILWWISAKKFIDKDKYKFHWRGLSIIFYILAIDESFRIHDRINEGVAGGWVIYYLVLVAIIGVSYLFFVFSLPKKTRNLIILAGSLYVGGAIGMEIVGVYAKKYYSYYHIYYRIVLTIEESLEFIGLIVFIKALLSYITFKYSELKKELKIILLSLNNFLYKTFKPLKPKTIGHKRLPRDPI